MLFDVLPSHCLMNGYKKTVVLTCALKNSINSLFHTTLINHRSIPCGFPPPKIYIRCTYRVGSEMRVRSENQDGAYQMSKSSPTAVLLGSRRHGEIGGRSETTGPGEETYLDIGMQAGSCAMLICLFFQSGGVWGCSFKFPT